MGQVINIRDEYMFCVNCEKEQPHKKVEKSLFKGLTIECKDCQQRIVKGIYVEEIKTSKNIFKNKMMDFFKQKRGLK